MNYLNLLIFLLCIATPLFSGTNPLAGKNLISIDDLSKDEIELILDTAQKLKDKPNPELLKGYILATCFFEPSTRTRLSFESSMHRLGGSVIGFSDSNSTSTKKGESLSDTIKTVSNFSDVIVIRHPLEGSAKIAADISNKPVINAGDGANQHPTQALLDLFTIRECQGKIDGLNIAIVGDLKYGRTIHSLCLLLAHYNVHISFVSVPNLELPHTIYQHLQKKGISLSFHNSLDEAIANADILYVTRIQKERFPDDFFVDNSCLLKIKHLDHVKANLKILHPLPRVDEIEPIIDNTEHAYYFQQVANGIPVRMAILTLLLDKSI